MSKIDNHYEIIKTLIGEIEPRGDANIDNDRYENLEKTIKLVESLLNDIGKASFYKKSPAYSEWKIGAKADEFLKDLKEVL